MIRRAVSEYRKDLAWDRDRGGGWFDRWLPEVCLAIFCFCMTIILALIAISVLVPGLGESGLGEAAGGAIIGSGLVGAAGLFGAMTGIATRSLYRKDQAERERIFGRYR